MTGKKIGIIGCGNMGEALLRGLSTLVEKSTSLMVSEFDAKRREYIQSKYKVIVKTDNNEILKFADVIILAVKPKDFDDLLKKEVCCGITKNKLLISIAAGITTKYIEKIIGKDIPVVRVMPNIAAAIGESISSISAGSSATVEGMNLAKEIFSTIGDVVEVDEKKLDAVTAVSGSGPAYFFYMIESLVEAARASGLDEDISKLLVLKTALGSVKLLEILKEEPSVLRAKVASRGGTTEAALKIFESKKIKDIVKAAVRAAQKRSKELSRS
jgi:pyrroline-5-carboxylate reductase